MKKFARMLIATAVALGAGVAAAPSAAAWTCPTTKVEEYKLYQPGVGTSVGWMTRWDTAFSCPSNTGEEKKSYTRSAMNGGAYHTITHSIYDMSDGSFLRSTTKSGYDTLQTLAIKNRTQAEYHYSGFLVKNINGTRLIVEQVS